MQTMRRALKPEVFSTLQTQGFCVVDNFFGAERCAALLSEVRDLSQHGLLTPNTSHFVKPSSPPSPNSTYVLPKSNIFEMELFDQIRPLVPHFREVDEDDSLMHALSAGLPLSLESRYLKMQHNTGDGGCFPMHTDSARGIDQRQVSAIVYLNQAWEPSHGGQLQLFPFPWEPLLIEPLMDRLVLMSSPHMVHRVLPSFKDRYCFTIWFSGSLQAEAETATASCTTRSVGGGEIDWGGGRSWAQILKAAPHITKLIYQDQWVQSIISSHPDTPERQMQLDTFHEEVAVIERALGSATVKALQQSLPFPRTQASRVPDTNWITY